MDWGRLGAAIATGGVSELGRAIDDAAKQAAREDAQQQKVAAEAAKQAAAADHRCCTPSPVDVTPHYQFVSGFLIDTENGRVWRYDDKKDTLLIVSRQTTEIERSWEAVLKAKATADLYDELADASKGATLAQRLRLDQLIEPHFQLVDEQIKALGKGAGR
jgi:hypothetical protein